MDQFFSSPNANQLNEKHREALNRLSAAHALGPIMLNEAGDFVTWPIQETPRLVAEVVSIEETRSENRLVSADGEAA